MTAKASTENFRQHKSTFYLILEQILAFNSSRIIVREVKNLSPNSEQYASCCFMLLIFSFGLLDPLYRKTLNSSTKNYTQIAHEIPIFSGIFDLFW